MCGDKITFAENMQCMLYMYVQDRLNRNDQKVYYALNTVYEMLSSININQKQYHLRNIYLLFRIFTKD